MRIAVTSDIHIDRNGEDTLQALAARVRALQADVLVVAGDIATPLDVYFHTLRTLCPCAGELVLVAGNHDVWCSAAAQAEGWNAWRRLDVALPALARDVGAHLLDAGPVVLGGVAFVGTMGWYDLSFRDEELEVPAEAYRTGAWGGVRWMDPGLAVFPDEAGAPMPVEAVADRLLGRLQAALRIDAERIVAVTHVLPFRAQAWRAREPVWRFVNAFMGCSRLGELLAADPRVELVISGHTHIPSDREIGGLRALVTPLGYRREWRGLDAVGAVERSVQLVELAGRGVAGGVGGQ